VPWPSTTASLPVAPAACVASPQPFAA